MLRAMIGTLAAAVVIAGCAGAGNGGSSGSDGGDTSCPEGNSLCEQMLPLVNEARATSTNCGGQVYPAVDAIGWDERLADAAASHSRDMAENNFFSHTGSDGLGVGDRVTNNGYSWSFVAENIAGGRQSVESVVEGWLDSSDHCVNIMHADVTEMGAASASNSASRYDQYWTQVFAAPR